MAKPEWGLKRICQNCNALFYDMRREPIVCPSCDTPFDPEQAVRMRRSRSAVPSKEPTPVRGESEDEVDPEEEATADTDDAEDEDILEDASDLGEDEEIDAIKKGDGDSEE